MASINNIPTLFAMATRNAIRNVDQIDAIGDIPYDMVEPILRQIKSPQQLRDLEENSPHVKAHSKNLWLAFIRRDIPRSEKSMMTPKNPLNWGGIYRYMLKQDLKLKEQQEELLKKEMLGLTDKKEKSTFLPQVVKQAAVRSNFVDGNPNPNKRHNTWNGVRIPTVKNAKSGQFIAALKKEAQDTQAARALAARHAKGEKTRFIPSAKAQIKTAPYDMLANHQKPQASDALLRSVRLESSQRKAGIFAPSFSSGRVAAKNRALDEAEARERELKEDRLRALVNPESKPTMPSSSANATSTSTRHSNDAVKTTRSNTVSGTQSSRYTLSTPTARRNPAPAPTSTPSSRMTPSVGTAPRSPDAPQMSTKTSPGRAALTVHSRRMATPKSRLDAGSTRPSDSRSPINATKTQQVNDGVQQAVKHEEYSSSVTASVPLPIIRKRAPAKLFINHAPKRVKQ